MLIILTIYMSYMLYVCFFFFKQKTAYEMRISDWSSDVRSSDLLTRFGALVVHGCPSIPPRDASSHGDCELAPVLSPIIQRAWRDHRATRRASGASAPDSGRPDNPRPGGKAPRNHPRVRRPVECRRQALRKP